MTKRELERNIAIYPFYRAFSYDFLFLWTISIMYLTWKGMSYSQAIFLDAIFMLSAFILQIPIAKLIKKVGRDWAVRFAAVCCVLFCVIFLFCNAYIWFILANVLYGISAAIKNICDTEILAMSLSKLDRDDEFSKYEGRGTFWHYAFESVSAILSGYMFQWISPNAPIVATFICSIFLLLFAILLKDPKNAEVLPELKPDKSKNNKTILTTDMKLETANDNMPEYALPFKHTEKKKSPSTSYKTLLKDKFILSMVVFCFCFYGIMSVYSTLAKVYYQQIGIKVWMFGYIYFVFKLVTAISSKYQFKYEKKRGVKSLIIFTVLTIIAFGLNGIIGIINKTSLISMLIISTMFIIQNAIRAPYRIFVKDYINMSSSKKNLTKILTLYSMAEYSGYAFITLSSSFVMKISNNSFGITNLVIVSMVALPMMISIIIFMREFIKKRSKKHTIIRDEFKEEI